ncbi:hypothetical protein MUG91_G74n1, partial [Manis pentadactyla]
GRPRLRQGSGSVELAPVPRVAASHAHSPHPRAVSLKRLQAKREGETSSCQNALGSGKGVRAGEPTGNPRAEERTACARGAGDGVAAGARSRFALSLPELPQPESRAASTVKVSS